MSFVSTLLIALISAGGLQSPVPQLPSGTHELVVIVEDENGGRVPGATVVVRPASSATERIETSDAGGRSAFPGLAPARYLVEVFSTGFRPATSEVDLPAADPLRVRLEAAPVVEEVHVVSASRI
jgi:hypothetical protein